MGEDLDRHLSKKDMQVANKHTKMLLTSLIIGKVQLKNTLRQAEWPSLKNL